MSAARSAPAAPAPEPSGRSLAAALADGVLLVDENGTVREANAVFCELTGLRRSELVGSRPPYPWLPSDETLVERAVLGSVVAEGFSLEGDVTLRRADGSLIETVASISALGDDVRDPAGWAIVIRDVTEQRLLEETMRESEESYRLLAENSSDVVARASADARLLYVSPSVERITGLSPLQISGRRLTEMVHPSDVRAVVGALRELRAGAASATATVRIRNGTGSWAWIDAMSRPMNDASGQLLEVHISARDVTERMRAERATRQMAEELGFVARYAGDVISVHAPDGTFTSVSDASRVLWRREPADMTGCSPLIFVHPEDRGPVAEAFARARAHDAGHGETLSYRVQHPDGQEVVVDTNVRAIRDDEGHVSAVICVSRDATARVAAEQAATERAERSSREAAEQVAQRRVAIAAATEHDPHHVLGIAAREVADLLDAEFGLVARFEGPWAHVLGVHGTLPWTVGAKVPLSGGGALSEVSRVAEAVRVSACEDPTCAACAALGYREGIAAPVRVDGELWGGVLAASTSTTIPSTGGAEQRLQRFADLVGVAVSAADARARLAAQAVTDPLTQLANHRAFHETLRNEVARARRHGRDLTLAVLDIDHFKRLNDVHGHQVGDAVLAEVGARLGAAARAGEVVARIGGEEFAWILPETPATGATDALERARQSILDPPIWGSERITLSVGVCDLSRAASADELFRLADGALYWAKANGRDMVCRYSPDVVEILSAEDRARHLERTQALTALRSLARAVDARDASTKAHSERVAGLSHDLAIRLGWPVERAVMLRDSALLHDVGKLGIPDAVLFKPGSLETDEYEVVKRHAVLGAEITSDALTTEQCSWIMHHHEHWNGGGYPDGLRGAAIPEGARVIAVVDAWDVMTRARHYGTVRTPVEAARELARCAGSQFWPPATEALIATVGMLDSLAGASTV